MDEVENSEVQEVATQETETKVANEQTQQETAKSDERQERNWRAMRQKQETLEQELRLQREMNERLLQMTQSQPKVQEPDELDSLSDDEFIPKGKVKKLLQKEKDKIVQEALAEVDKRQQKHHQAQFMDRLKRQYQDFEEIVNPETLSLLEEQEPELAKTIVESNDPYKIGMQSYKYIKALGISDKAPTARRAKEVEKKLEKNEKTVQSPQAYEKRPLAQAFKLTDAEKKNLYKEMMDSASQASFSY